MSKLDKIIDAQRATQKRKLQMKLIKTNIIVCAVIFAVVVGIAGSPPQSISFIMVALGSVVGIAIGCIISLMLVITK